MPRLPSRAPEASGSLPLGRRRKEDFRALMQEASPCASWECWRRGQRGLGYPVAVLFPSVWSLIDSFIISFPRGAATRHPPGKV